MNRPAVDIMDAVADAELFAPWFRDVTTWRAWFVFLRAMFGLPLDADGLATFQSCTGRSAPVPSGYLEASLVIGRRGGKSLILALIAAFLACFHDWAPFLTPGERGTIVVIAADRKQARAIFRYLKGMLSIPVLAALIERETAEALDLSNNVTIEIQTASFRTVRGLTLVAALCDEVAFWRTDEGTANPDTEILAALKPAMATIPGAMLLKASSPYARRGVLWNDYRKYYAKDDAFVLVWQADTRTMNPSVPQSFIDEAYEADPASAAAEYGAQFRSDIESFISREAVDAVVVEGRHELPPATSIDYRAFVDPSGGSSDSMTLGIAHKDGEKAVLDALRERKPPFSPEDVVAEFSALLKTYRISRVTGDNYAGEWPKERFAMHGVRYDRAAKPKSDIYRDLLPLINSSRVELLDHQKMVAQLCALERRTSRGGRDSIDHPPNAHDDLINAVAGVLVEAAVAQKKPMYFAAPVSLSQGRLWPGDSSPSARPCGEPINSFGGQSR